MYPSTQLTLTRCDCVPNSKQCECLDPAAKCSGTCGSPKFKGDGACDDNNKWDLACIGLPSCNHFFGGGAVAFLGGFLVFSSQPRQMSHVLHHAPATAAASTMVVIVVSTLPKTASLVSNTGSFITMAKHTHWIHGQIFTPGWINKLIRKFPNPGKLYLTGEWPRGILSNDVEWSRDIILRLLLKQLVNLPVETACRRWSMHFGAIFAKSNRSLQHTTHTALNASAWTPMAAKEAADLQITKEMGTAMTTTSEGLGNVGLTREALAERRSE